MERAYQGRTALITGASTGQAIAERLARDGAKVILVARREERLAAIAEDIRGQGGQALALAFDLSQVEALGDLARRVKEETGRLDLLVNNAGREQLVPLQAVPPRAVQELVQLNLISPVLLTRGLLGLLKEGSAVVFIASTAALRGAAGSAVYAATKGALVSLTRSLALEWASRRVRVNAVAPGQVRTDMLERLLARVSAEQGAQMEALHPLGFGEPGDVAAAVAFLGGPEAKWITGQVLAVDGGYSA
jgi:NAD(P)-dependent dehydrogenase (short-subunit alcohol dehydrogenase family)